MTGNLIQFDSVDYNLIYNKISDVDVGKLQRRTTRTGMNCPKLDDGPIQSRLPKASQATICPACQEQSLVADLDSSPGELAQTREATMPSNPQSNLRGKARG